MSLLERLPLDGIVVAMSLIGVALSLWMGIRQARALRDLTDDRSWLLSVLSLSWDEPDRAREMRSMSAAVGPLSKIQSAETINAVRHGRTRKIVSNR